MNMIKGNTLFMKKASHLVTYECGPLKTQANLLKLIRTWSLAGN